jgi:hypothetical protein
MSEVKPQVAYLSKHMIQWRSRRVLKEFTDLAETMLDGRTFQMSSWLSDWRSSCALPGDNGDNDLPAVIWQGWFTLVDQHWDLCTSRLGGIWDTFQNTIQDICTHMLTRPSKQCLKRAPICLYPNMHSTWAASLKVLKCLSTATLGSLNLFWFSPDIKGR